ncbi:SRPBCC domain-containing protein [Blastococcus montanus]|uniref:SRPBCC domain-containing protein n=1 Tax=Blastococcus montanus TaxID=3144973 RepID=UPI0032086F99
MARLLYTGPGFATLHEQYASRGRIDTQAQIFSASEIDIRAGVEQVWAVVADVAGYPALDPAFGAVRPPRLAAGEPLSFRIRGFPVRAVLAVVRPPHELTWTGRSLWVNAVDRHVLEPLPGGGTRLRVAESLAGAFVPWLFTERRLRAQHLAWLEGVKRTAEAG